MNLDFIKEGIIVRNWKFHLVVFLFCVLVTAIYFVGRRNQLKPGETINLFLSLLVQLELFLAIAFKIFSRIKTGTDRKEITRIMLLKFALFMAICFLISLILVVISALASSIIMGFDPGAALTAFFEKNFTVWVKQTIGGLMFGAAIFIFIQWQDALKREQKLREENLIFQNETLKSQVNPHFLFNSLNTISSLVSTQPETAERFVRNLSSVYRYILENGQKDNVPLQSELDFITDYFNLHRIRGEEKIELIINTPGSASFSILPVSLQILVENAIKHNKATRENPLKIEVNIENRFIVVKNNLQRMAMQIASTGIGLKNLAERVKLSTGKSLVVEETDSYFIVKVPLT
jgi:two-component system LytT family sensor kinase